MKKLHILSDKSDRQRGQFLLIGAAFLSFMIAILYFIFHKGSRTVLGTLDNDGSPYSYVTYEALEELLEERMKTELDEEKAKVLYGYLYSLDNGYGNIDNLSLSDIRGLYAYVDRAVNEAYFSLPDDLKGDLTNDITTSILSKDNKAKEDEVRELISDLQFELSLIKDSGYIPSLTSTGYPLDEQMEFYMDVSGLSRDVIKDFIDSSNVKLKNEYMDEDSYMYEELSDRDAYLESLLDDAGERLDTLYNDIVYLNEDKFDLDEAVKRLSEVEDLIDELYRALDDADVFTNSAYDDLLIELITLKSDLAGSRDDLESLVEANRRLSEKAAKDVKDELSDSIKENKRKQEDALNRTNENLKRSIEESNEKAAEDIKKTNDSIKKTTDRVKDLESKSLLEYRLDDTDPDDAILYLTPVDIFIDPEGN